MINKISKFGFTMAEILLSLTIIGVVAAITLPSLTGNINERTWNTQRKALYARMSQAVSLLPSITGYGGSYTAATGTSGTSSYKEASDNYAERFITEGLSKVYKINNICDYQHLTDCGLPSKYTAQTGSTNDFPTDGYGVDCNFHVNVNGSTIYPKAAAFETQNGESIAVYYKFDCLSADQLTAGTMGARAICVDFIYDLNGTKGPNTIFKDIGFMTLFYPTDPVLVAPVLIPQATAAVSQANAGNACKNLDAESRLPNLEEGAAIHANSQIFLGGASHIPTWTSTIYDKDTTKGWYVTNGSEVRTQARTTTLASRCVKR